MIATFAVALVLVALLHYRDRREARAEARADREAAARSTDVAALAAKLDALVPVVSRLDVDLKRREADEALRRR